MKITIEHYSDKYSLEIAGDPNINDMYEVFQKMLDLLGFHPDSIKDLVEGR